MVRGVLDELQGALPDGAVVTDPDVTAGYRQDWAKDPSAALPLAVVRAGSSEDVAATLRWASARGVPVVVRGAGSGLSGGATALAGGIVLSLERMRAVRVEPAMRVIVAQAGALNAAVKAAAAEHGLWYPPDPSSFEISSIGGNVATNAGGLCCVKYGVTTDYVLGLEVVLADGTVVRLGGPRLKDVAGLSLTKLFVGSEGILGVVTEVTLRLLPAQPPQATLVATFDSVRRATEAVLAVTARVRPALLELMDGVSVRAVEASLHLGLDPATEGLLLVRSDAPGEAAAQEIALVEAACREFGALEVYTTDDPVEGEQFAAARRSALPALVGRSGKDYLLEDVGVPLPQLPALITGVHDIGRRHDVLVALVAHAGDGNSHPVIVHDAADADESARAQAAFEEIVALALQLGGTITGEHGIGRLKAPFLPDYLGPDVMALSRRIKDALDPNGVLNPGVMF